MKILIVDDDASFREMLEETLKNAGYEIIMAKNGLLALEKLKKEDVDMVILDVNMPKMNGFELLTKMRNDEKLKNIPVLMLTIRDFADDQERGYKTGADDYLTKPFDDHILIAKIKVLERRLIEE
jgi:DNA-binding response OmpR family regulator